MYQALYRKWRPKTFDDVVGQDAITTTLKHQVQSGEPSHAYLFCGSRGTGKTSCSKILAKAVNCPNANEGNPCGVCEICLGIDNDKILDVTEIDAASNSGVDNIRELREEAGFTPVTTRYRVYIIDETHMLSAGAFNALLKIMEEPPPHVIFILATTEIHKVPATILSRCQRFDFRRLDSRVIADRLLFVADQESIKITDEAAMLIAYLSDGGMRDALSLLDLCRTIEGEIDYTAVQSLVGLADDGYLTEMISYVRNRQYDKILTLMAELWEKSIDPVQLCGQISELYRNLLVAKSVENPQTLINLPIDKIDRIKVLAGELSTEEIFYGISVIGDTASKIAKTSRRRGELELGLLKLAKPELNPQSDAFSVRIERIEAELKARGENNNTHDTSWSQQSVKVSDQKTKNTEKTTAQSEKPAETKVDLSEKLSLDCQSEESDMKVFDHWGRALESLIDINKALYGTLLNSKAYIAGDFLLIDAGNEMFQTMVRSDEYAKKSLREAVFIATGKRYKLGPYKRGQNAVETDKFADILECGKSLGLDIEIKE